MMKKITTTIILTILLVILGSLAAYAYEIDPTLKPINEPFDIGETLQDEGAAGGAVRVLQIISGGLLYFAAPIAIIMIAFSGFTIVTGGAEPEKLEQGKKHLTWSVIGLLTIILSYSLVKIVINLAYTSGQG